MDERERIEELENEIHGTTAWDLIGREHRLGNSFRILEGNCHDIALLANAYSAGQFQSDNNGWFIKHELFSCMDRYLHNFTSSAATLRNHLHKHCCSAPERLTRLCSEEEVRRFGSSPLARFVEILRDYTTHIELPRHHHATHTVDSGGTSSRILVSDVAKLNLIEGRRSKPAGWEEASEYIRQHPKGMVISEMAEEFLSLMREFCEWLVTTHTQEFQEEFARIVRLSAEIEEMTLREQQLWGFSNPLSNAPYLIKNRFYSSGQAWLSVSTM